MVASLLVLTYDTVHWNILRHRLLEGREGGSEGVERI